MKIALILNTRTNTNEFEVEYDPPHTRELIKHGILATGHQYEFIEADENFVEKLKEIKPDLVFNRAEGMRGESRESHVQAILEMLEIPYVGSKILATALALNKTWTKKYLAYHKILTPKFYTISKIEQFNKNRFPFPVILKPNEEGSSIGINEDNVVYNMNELKTKFENMVSTYKQPILVEQFIEGREFSVGLLGRGDDDPEVLAIIEIDFSKMPSDTKNVFGQRAKTVYDSLDNYVCPAKILRQIKKRLEQISINIWNLMEINDFARIDFRMNSKKEIYFLEVNPLPGMDFDLENNDYSFYPYMAMESGYTYDQLIYRILQSACLRYGISM